VAKNKNIKKKSKPSTCLVGLVLLICYEMSNNPCLSVDNEKYAETLAANKQSERGNKSCMLYQGCCQIVHLSVVYLFCSLNSICLDAGNFIANISKDQRTPILG